MIYTREADFSSDIWQETPAYYRIVIDQVQSYRIDDLTGPGTFHILKPEDETFGSLAFLTGQVHKDVVAALRISS